MVAGPGRRGATRRLGDSDQVGGLASQENRSEASQGAGAEAKEARQVNEDRRDHRVSRKRQLYVLHLHEQAKMFARERHAEGWSQERIQRALDSMQEQRERLYGPGPE